MLSRRDFIRRIIGSGFGLALAPAVLIAHDEPQWKTVAFAFSEEDWRRQLEHRPATETWLEGIVTYRSPGHGIIRAEDARRYRFTSGALLRNFTTSDNTRVGDTVWFRSRRPDVADSVSWKQPSNVTFAQVLEEHVAQQAQALADHIDADILRRFKLDGTLTYGTHFTGL